MYRRRSFSLLAAIKSPAAWFTLVLSLSVTIWGWHHTKTDIEQSAGQHFSFRADEIKRAILDRMLNYELVLRGGAGLFAGSESVKREEWRAYVNKLKIEQSYPGIQGIGYSVIIPPSKKDSHVREVRSRGFSNYRIWPEGNRDVYTSIIYLEPFDWRNQRAFGYDMLSEPVRRAAMERARDTDTAVISEKVILVQETGQGAQTGFLMYMPVYRNGAPSSTVEERRRAVLGYVYSPFRMNDLMRGILGRNLPDVGLEIFDGDRITAGSIMYDSVGKAGRRSAFSRTATIDLNGRTWTLRFTSLPSFDASIDRDKPRMVLTGGILISLLFFAIVGSLAANRAVAQAMNEVLHAEVIERKRAEEELKKAHDELEGRVQERTAELVKANKALKEEASERERVTTALAEQSRILEAFFKHTITPLVLLDENFNFIMVNEAYARACLRDTSEFPGHNHFEFYPNESNEEIFKGVVRTRKPFQITAKPFVFPDHPEWGVTYWDWTLFPVLDKKEEIDFLVFSLKDVTESKLAEEALRKSEERFRSLVETTTDWVWEVNEHAVYTYASPKIRDILGYEPEEIIGKTPFDLMPPDEAERIAGVFFEIAETKRPFALLENLNLRKDGTPVVLETSGTPILGSDGRLLGYRGIDRDITARRRVEEEKEQIQTRLLKSQKMETIGKLAAGIAHDFNNIITIINSLSSLAIRKTGEADPAHKFLEQIISTAERASNLTRQLLIFSRSQPTRFAPVNITAAVNDLIKLMYHLIGENFTIRTYFAPGVWAVMADRGNVEQLLMNLVINARDAMPHGGEITIRAENITLDEELCRTIREARPGRFVCLTVEDTGAGMDQSVIDRLFEPFFSTKAVGQGIGLGLNVVYNIVKEHHGGIAVCSEPTKGSAFRVYLPATTEEALAVDKKVLAEPVGRGERILLVEDEGVLRKSVALVLIRNGYRVFEAADAEEAINIYEKEGGDFDLIFSDVVLRGKDGVRLVDELLAKKPGLKVLFASGYMDVESQWPYIQEKGFRFIQKPYEIPDLLRTVREAMGGEGQDL